MRILKWIKDNALFVCTLFLLALIPLYPKRPLFDIEHTWVYIRVEDFAVAFVLITWLILFLLKKVTLKTPLTFPLLMFWIVGGLATIHGVLLIFPILSDVYSNVAFLSYLRRIEYMSMFFVAYAGMKDKKFLPYVISTLVIVLLLVVGYGFGQKFLGFPAFLTMNEEFAKGIPIQLSQLSRVPSTFAGHYDLAAYLVLIIPLVTSMFFGFKNWIVKIILLVTALSGFALLFMTVSRVSVFVLLLAMVMLLLLQRKKWVIISLVFLTVLLLSFSPSLLQRYGSSVTEVDVLVDRKTGDALGQVKDVPAKYFENKIITRVFTSEAEKKYASSSAILPHSMIPERAALLIESNAPTGETLPQGTGYINLPLSLVKQRIGQYFYEKPITIAGTQSAETRVVFGDYLIKKAVAYDLSFTTRFQGEWPRTILAFQRNIFLGSGYSSVSLAVDNDYLRMLGESGLLGFVAFFAIFFIAFIYIKKAFPHIDSPVVKSFVLGFTAGTFGLALNAVLIDVFEASKIAFTYWLLMGVTLGTLHLYHPEEINIFKAIKKILFSNYAIVLYLFLATAALFSGVYNNYFVGDDFTWFRWIADCSQGVVKAATEQCYSVPETIFRYFTDANGFFYRPGTKLYFFLMYSLFWLNQTIYHFTSVLLHFFVGVLVYLITKRILRNNFLSAISAFLFLLLSGHAEAVFWISSTGFLFNALFILLGLLSFIYWKERRHTIYFVLSFVCVVLSLLFHELGVVGPLLIILYDVVFGEKSRIGIYSRKLYYAILLFPILPYLILRFTARSHWFSGDYSYNIFKLPYNIVGNIIGYFSLDLFGTTSLSFYDALRNFSKTHIFIAIIATLVLAAISVWAYKILMKNLTTEERKVVIFGFMFFVLALLPFLGLGNITSRYSYLSSVGFVILLTFFFKKIYVYLVGRSGKYIGSACMLILLIIFFMTQLFQLQKLQTDWKSAGERTMTFLISLDGMYINSWNQDPMKFYFVNVPIRTGNAWIFPVGLRDAVWFGFRNNNIEVHQEPTLKKAFEASSGSLNEKVFLFNGDGSVIEKNKPRKAPLIR